MLCTIPIGSPGELQALTGSGGEKLILPFYSHYGGTLGDIRGAIKKLYTKANVKEVLGVCNDEERNLKEPLYDWLGFAGILMPPVQMR